MLFFNIFMLKLNKEANGANKKCSFPMPMGSLAI